MVLLMRNRDAEDTMPQTVPSAGFTPPCDYSTFAENFDLSLLPGGDLPISPSTQFYDHPQQQQQQVQPKIHTTFYPSSPESSDIELGPDFRTLLSDDSKEERSGGAYLEVPTKGFGGYRENNFYPSSPEQSLYTASPGSVYSTSPHGDDHYHHLQQQQQHQHHLQHSVKREVCSASTSPLPGFFSPFGIKEESGCYLFPTSPSSYSSSSPEHHVGGQQVDNTDVLGGLFNSTTSLDKQIKQESTVDFTNILQGFQDTDTLRQLLEKDLKPKPPETETDKPKDHRLLREVLRDTSFQKRFNIRPIDFLFAEGDEDIKMEEPGESHSDLMRTCNEPVIKEAIEKTTKDVVNTCATLGISADPSQWDPASVLSWLRWTCKHYRNHTNPPLPEPIPEQWEISGATLITLPVSEFVRRMPEGGAFLHGHLEIWKAAFSSPEEEMNRNWRPETTSSNASSGDVSDEEEEEAPQPQSEPARPSTSTRSSSNIHLWQFLKELLGSNQHGSCIRWVHREEGIFKIEDSVKVARLWGKRKNRPAMNYDKLSRSIRQYYKKGIMKKPERSQRLVYQFCTPYNF